jgi:hypothetical protein
MREIESNDSGISKKWEYGMTSGKRWRVCDRYGNEICLTQERWEHIIDPFNYPEMVTVKTGKRKQDSLIPQKYRYAMAFDNLAEDNTHIVAIVLFGFSRHVSGNPVPNNYIVTAYQKEIG